MKKKDVYIFREERTNKDLTALAQSLQPFMKVAAKRYGLAEADILANWENIAGAELASYSQPIKICFNKSEKVNGSLYIAVPNGAFALELQHREKFIIEKINTYFGYAAVAHLKILQNAGMELVPEKQYSAEKVKKILVTKDEENYITKLSEGVANEKLKAALIKLGVSVFNENKEE